MRVRFLDIPRQYSDLKERIDADIAEIMTTGAYVVGKHNKALEEEIASYHGCKYAIALNSGTDALRILLDALKIGPGDEVITTAFTFVATVEVIVQTGAKPVFVDIRAEDQMIDPALIEAAITPNTKAIMPIHLWGQMADMKPIMEIACKHGIHVIEDAAQAIGSKQDGKYAGNFSMGAGLSFYVTKNLGAAGDGGMILTNFDEVHEASRSMRIHGMGRERYYYDHVGYTSRMAELQAAVLRAKLTQLEQWNTARQRIADMLLDGLAGTGLHLPSINEGNNHTWHQFTIRSNRRDELQSFLREREVDSMIYYPVPLHYHVPYQHLATRGSLPITEEVSEQVLSLPVQQYLTDEEVRWVIESVKAFQSVAV